MPETAYTQVVHPYKGDPFVGHLSTPISDSGFTRTFIGNLPAYRKGLSPILRGLEIGMAHGYWLAGPWVIFGPMRDSDVAVLGGLLPALVLILVATAGLSVYGIVSFQDETGQVTNPLQTAEGWSQFTAGFFLGGMGGAFIAYFLLGNFQAIDNIFRGVINY